jgi:hypothetical protein
MKIIGVQLRKPSFWEVTAAAIMACGLWLACVGVMKSTSGQFDRIEAGALLLVIFWGCVGARIGVRIDRGMRHLALNLIGCALIVSTYQATISLLT